MIQIDQRKIVVAQMVEFVREIEGRALVEGRALALATHQFKLSGVIRCCQSAAETLLYKTPRAVRDSKTSNQDPAKPR